jgi:5-methylcytosine-specific restriction endonuclease McrA
MHSHDEVQVSMVNLVPACGKCNAHVTDSLEAEVEKQGQLKRGKYINSVWMFNDCAEAQ